MTSLRARPAGRGSGASGGGTGAPARPRARARPAASAASLPSRRAAVGRSCRLGCVGGAVRRTTWPSVPAAAPVEDPHAVGVDREPELAAQQPVDRTGDVDLVGPGGELQAQRPRAGAVRLDAAAATPGTPSNAVTSVTVVAHGQRLPRRDGGRDGPAVSQPAGRQVATRADGTTVVAQRHAAYAELRDRARRAVRARPGRRRRGAGAGRSRAAGRRGRARRRRRSGGPRVRGEADESDRRRAVRAPVDVDDDEYR